VSDFDFKYPSAAGLPSHFQSFTRCVQFIGKDWIAVEITLFIKHMWRYTADYELEKTRKKADT
jgi:hypothetical protein